VESLTYITKLYGINAIKLLGANLDYGGLAKGPKLVVKVGMEVFEQQILLFALILM
jgi:hypothetical protein